MFRGKVLALLLLASPAFAVDYYYEDYSTNTVTVRYETQGGQPSYDADTLDGFHGAYYLSTTTAFSSYLSISSGTAIESRINEKLSISSGVVFEASIASKLSISSGTEVERLLATKLSISSGTEVERLTNLRLHISSGVEMERLLAPKLSTGVVQLIAGSNITLTPTDGKGIVTIASSGGGGSVEASTQTIQLGSGVSIFVASGTFAAVPAWTYVVTGDTLVITSIDCGFSAGVSTTSSNFLNVAYTSMTVNTQYDLLSTTSIEISTNSAASTSVTLMRICPPGSRLSLHIINAVLNNGTPAAGPRATIWGYRRKY